MSLVMMEEIAAAIEMELLAEMGVGAEVELVELRYWLQ